MGMDPIPSFEESRKLRIQAGVRSTKCVEQICIDTGRVLRRYISGTDAAVAMQVSQSGISLCCSGIKPDAYGFKWRVCDDPDYGDPYEEVPIEILLEQRVMKGKNQYTSNPTETRLEKIEKKEEKLLQRERNKEKGRQKRAEKDEQRREKQRK